MRKRIIQIAGIAMIGALLLNYGCKKDETAAGPVLPPMETLAINTDDFPSTSKFAPDPNYNYNLAVLALTYWNGVLVSQLGVPIAVYAVALQQTPAQLDEDTWKWTFSTDVGGETYVAELIADVGTDSINVDMYISMVGGFQSFLWYEGKFDVERTGGYWTVYLSPIDPVAWLKIDWNINWTSETFDTKYTIVLATHDYYESYIQYGITDDPTYDAFYDLYDSFEDVLYSIDYNTTTTAGRICNGSIGCLYWDENHENYIPPVK